MNYLRSSVPHLNAEVERYPIHDNQTGNPADQACKVKDTCQVYVCGGVLCTYCKSLIGKAPVGQVVLDPRVTPPTPTWIRFWVAKCYELSTCMHKTRTVFQPSPQYNLLCRFSNDAFPLCASVCVLRIKPLLLPVDIRHNQFPCRLFNAKERHNMSVHKTTPQRRYISMHYAEQTIRCHVVVLDTTATTHTFY